MRLLFIDTVSNPNVFIISDEDGVQFEQQWYEPGKESEHMQKTMLDAQLPDQPITHILAINGPGRFTSTRIGVACANALAFSKNIPIIALDRLELVSRLSMLGGTSVFPFEVDMESEKQDYYHAVFSDSSFQHSIEIQEDVSAEVMRRIIFHTTESNPGWEQYKEKFLLFVREHWKDFHEGSMLVPVYVKEPNITVQKKL